MKLIIDIPNSLYANLAKIGNGSIAGKRIIESVKQGKPYKSDVLDKIRAEIEKPLHDERCFDTADAKAQYIALNWCIEIIDKYRAESEDA